MNKRPALSPPLNEAPPSLETLCVESVVKQALAQPLAAETFSDEILALALQLRRSDPKDVLLDDVVCFTRCTDLQSGRKSINLPFRLLPDFVKILVRACVHNDDTRKRQFLVDVSVGKYCVCNYMEMCMDEMDVVAFGNKYEVEGQVCELVSEVGGATAVYEWADEQPEEISRHEWDGWVEYCANKCFDYSMYFVCTYVFPEPELADHYAFGHCCNVHAQCAITRELKDAIHLARNDVKPDALLQRVPVLTIELISD